MRPAQVLRRAADYLERHDVESPMPTAEQLLAGVLGTDRAGLYTREAPLGGDAGHFLECGVGQERTTEIRMQHGSGGVDDRPQRRTIFLRNGVRDSVRDFTFAEACCKSARANVLPQSSQCRTHFLGHIGTVVSA